MIAAQRRAHLMVWAPIAVALLALGAALMIERPPHNVGPAGPRSQEKVP